MLVRFFRMGKKSVLTNNEFRNHCIRVVRKSITGSFHALLLMALAFVLSVPAPGLAASPARAKTKAVPGTIAYINKNNTALHLVQPDGSNDRVLWTAPKAGGVQSAVRYPAWRPDGTELAFVSDMEQAESLLQSDVFAIRPDGKDLRKITDTPLHSKLGSFQEGSVAVQVTNVNSAENLFILYVQGAQAPQSITLTAGNTKKVTFQHVAIFPGQSQFPVAINGVTRWYGQPATPTFQPGITNEASISIQGSGYDNFGAFEPVWRSDSAEVDSTLGEGCVATGISANPPAGSAWGDLLVSFSASMCPMDRGPTPALSNQILYWDYLGNFPDGAFMQATEGAAQPTMLFDTGYASYVYGLSWLPDGTGFLYSFTDGNCSCSNIYAYDFGTKQSTQLTHFAQAYAGKLSTSPDGKKVVFEHFTVDPNPTLDPDAVPDLWLMNRDGSGAGLFIPNARDPSWGLQQAAPPVTNQLYLPLVEQNH